MTSKRFLSRVLFLMILVTSGCEDEKNAKASTAENALLRKALIKQERLNDSLQKIIDKMAFQEDEKIYFGRAFDSVENPEEFIIAALKQQPELIPLERVLGGTMEFRQIDVLTEDWVLAKYDDGHVEGKSIFQYELLPKGQLEFELLLSSPGSE